MLSMFLYLGYSHPSAQAQNSGFTTSNDRSLYDAQTRALRQKSRTQLETDTAKLKDLRETNDDLKSQTQRIKACADLDKVYNGDPTNSNNPAVYCQSIVGAIPSELNFKGLAAWYDVSTEDGYELNGSDVAKLLDKSGNLNHLEASGSGQPTIQTNNYSPKAGNGIKVMNFDGNDILKSTSNRMATALGIKGNYGASVFAVFNHDNTSSGNNFGVFSLGSGGAKSYTGILNYWSERYGVHHNSLGYAPDMKVSKGRLVMMDYHKAQNADPIAIYINGSLSGEAATGTPNVKDGDLRVGYWGTGYPMKGDIAELIIYNRKITASERASVQSYLMGKYSLQSFNSCASKTVNTGQCTTNTGSGNHGSIARLSCTGTFNKPCTNEQYCNDGTWEQTANSCPPPDNCTSSSNKSLFNTFSSCNASTGTGNHGVTKNLSCNAAFGPCTASSKCYNGVWGAPTSMTCTPPRSCPTTTIPISHSYGSCNASVSGGVHGSARTLNCAGSFGTCQAYTTCYDGAWTSPTSVNCPAPANCTSQSVSLYHCSTTSGSITHGTSTTRSCGNSTYGHRCKASISCYNGTVTRGSISCAPGCRTANAISLSTPVYRRYSSHGIRLDRHYLKSHHVIYGDTTTGSRYPTRHENRTDLSATVSTYDSDVGRFTCKTSYTTNYTSLPTNLKPTLGSNSLGYCYKLGTGVITCPTDVWKERSYKSKKNKNTTCATTNRPFRPTLGQTCATPTHNVSKSYACRDRKSSSKYRIHSCDP